MRRLALLAAAILGAALVAVAPTAADASQTSQNCKTVFDDGTGAPARMCIGIRVHGLNGGGWNLDEVDISIDGSYWESSPAVDCKQVTSYNDAGVAKWVRVGTCDVNKDPGYRTFLPDYAFPNTTQIQVCWSGYPKINFAKDPGYSRVCTTAP